MVLTEKCEEVLGPNHFVSLLAKRKCSRILSDLNQHKEAEAMLSEAIVRSEELLGAHNPETLKTKEDYAVTLVALE